MSQPLTVLLFGRLAERLGRQISVTVEGPLSIAELRRRIVAEQGDAARELLEPHVRPALDQRLVGEDALVAAGAEIAFLPPFSGG